MNQAVVDAISSILREKNIDRETFAEIIESVFLKAIEKRYGTAENFSVIFNMEKGDIEIYAEKIVVDDGEVEDEALEIELSRAQALDEDLEVGDEFVEVIDYNHFGRRLEQEGLVGKTTIGKSKIRAFPVAPALALGRPLIQKDENFLLSEHSPALQNDATSSHPKP